MFTKQSIIELSEDFVDDYLTTPELQQRFVDQVFDYANNCCETDQELFRSEEHTSELQSH